jgi:hypothetical protein
MFGLSKLKKPQLLSMPGMQLPIDGINTPSLMQLAVGILFELDITFG